MITKVSVKNFKVLRDVEAELRPLTLIVGPNASGKSTLLKILELFQATLWEHPLPWIDCMSRVPVGSELILEYNGYVSGISFRSIFRQEGQLTVKSITNPYEVRKSVQSPVSLSLNAQKIAAPSATGKVVYSLANDGAGLAWLLSGLYLENLTRYREIIDRLRSVIPIVRDVRIHRVHLPGEVGFELLFDTHAASNVPAHSVSEGTLLTLAILTALCSPEKPQLVLIDNLDQGLHPRAMKDLVAQLRSIQEQDPELQIVATSHSPYLLDAVNPEEVLLTSLDEDGYTVVKPLTQHPEYERWKDLMAPGEFWSTVGESWVAKAQ